MESSAGGTASSFRDFGEGRLVHLPGLDGLRGLAVVAVICFHGNWSWMRGGFLGVSLFFTLSGFLITSLLLVERSTGASLRRFWSRRFRRLLPAAWLTLAAVMVASWFLVDVTRIESVRGDVVASLAQVANWRFLLAETSYGDLFSAPSPVLHFWSLAIEEQFYLVYPALLAGLLAWAARRGRHRARAATVGVLGVATLASWFVPVVLGASIDRVYYGTDTRAGELLAGALLAVVVADAGVRRRLTARDVPRRVVAGIGTAALAVTVVLWVGMDRSSAFVSSGGLALVSVLSTLVVLAAGTGLGPVGVICGLRPLRWVGKVSYGAYLFHWPLFVFLTERRTGLGPVPRFLVVVAATFVLAGLSHRFVEQPVRLRQGWFAPGRLRPLAVAPVVLVALVAGSLVLVEGGSESDAFDFDRAQAQLEELQAQAARGEAEGDLEVPTTTQPEAPPPPRPVVSLYGDSTMLSLALLVGNWQLAGAPLTNVEGVVELGCGIARGGWRRVFDVERPRRECDRWPTIWAEQVREDDPDVVVVAAGQWEMVDHRLPGETTWRRMGDPAWDAYVKAEMLHANDVLASNGALVVWLNIPPFGTVDEESLPAWQRTSHEPARVARLNEITAEVVAERPMTARLVDLASWMAPRADDVSIRHDGTHYNWTAENPVVQEFLGPAILEVWGRWWTDLYELAAGRGEIAAGTDLPATGS